jgi:Zn-dependent peptidase ImmA (M78 family)
MTTNYNPESAADINKVVYDILKQSHSFDVYPTPVEAIVKYAELKIDKEVGLHNIPNHYISKKIDALKNALAKVFGALDRRKRIIYIGPDLPNAKKSFVQLHEVGHHALPWQRDTFEYVEDELSLSPDVQEQFETEANFFASASLFQLDRFEREAANLPLEISTVRYLAGKFGGSMQATFRRYVQASPKRAALLVLKEPTCFACPLAIRNWFASKRFSSAFPSIRLPETFSADYPFIKDYYNNKRWIDNPKPVSLNLDTESVEFEYRFFFNTHNVFVLITPPGEKISTRKSIVVA